MENGVVESKITGELKDRGIDIEDSLDEVKDSSFFQGGLRTVLRLPFTVFFAAGSLFLAVAISLILTIARYAIEVGGARFFITGYEKEDVEIKTVFSSFNSEWSNIFITQLKRSVFTTLWTLLFIIPGIIKALEYSFIPYILADHPELTSSEVFERSKELSSGNKWNIFVLGFSFIGWDILGVLFFGIGGIFVRPYKDATFASLYRTVSLERPL